jgi:hypothetical protein
MTNKLGLRNVSFDVDDSQATVDRLAAEGYCGPDSASVGREHQQTGDLQRTE